MNYKLAGREQLAAQDVPGRQVHKGVAGGSQRRGSVASPVMIGSNRKYAGNHPLSAGSPRQGATHRLDRCIVAPYPRTRIGRTYSPPAKAGGGSPPVGRARALSEGDCGSCGSRWTRLHFCQTASLAHAVGAGVSTLESPVHGVVYCHLIPPPACVNLPPAA